jgi:hypothetical protein
MDHKENTVLLLCSCLLLQERVYRAIPQKQPRYIGPSHGYCIAMALHAALSFSSTDIRALQWQDLSTTCKSTISHTFSPSWHIPHITIYLTRLHTLTLHRYGQMSNYSWLIMCQVKERCRTKKFLYYILRHTNNNTTVYKIFYITKSIKQRPSLCSSTYTTISLIYFNWS